MVITDFQHPRMSTLPKKNATYKMLKNVRFVNLRIGYTAVTIYTYMNSLIFLYCFVFYKHTSPYTMERYYTKKRFPTFTVYITFTFISGIITLYIAIITFPLFSLTLGGLNIQKNATKRYNVIYTDVLFTTETALIIRRLNALR